MTNDEFCRPVDYDAGSHPPPIDLSKTTLAEVRATFVMVFEKRVLLMIPMFMLCGTISVMWSSWFTRQMEKTVQQKTPTMSRKRVALGLFWDYFG